MKISKLFHWLYAILMLLPVFFIGVRCAYVVFNKNAKDSYSITLSSDTELSVITDNSIKANNYYNFTNNNSTFNGVSGDIIYTNEVNSISGNITLPNNLTSFRLYYNGNNNIYSIAWYGDTTTYTTTSGNGVNVNYVAFNFYATQNQNNVLTYYGSSIKQYVLLSNNTLDNAFIYSVNQLNEVPLFSWAKDSFLVEPFSYITGLFGVESTNPINTMLSYWLSVSIIWLVFDLVMYVPLLVHRWLDKGVLE